MRDIILKSNLSTQDYIEHVLSYYNNDKTLFMEDFMNMAKTVLTESHMDDIFAYSIGKNMCYRGKFIKDYKDIKAFLVRHGADGRLSLMNCVEIYDDGMAVAMREIFYEQTNKLVITKDMLK